MSKLLFNQYPTLYSSTKLVEEETTPELSHLVRSRISSPISLAPTID